MTMGSICLEDASKPTEHDRRFSRGWTRIQQMLFVGLTRIHPRQLSVAGQTNAGSIGLHPVAALNENDRLRAGYFKALATADVLAHKHVIDAHEIITRLLIAHSILLVSAPRRSVLFSPLHPTHFVIRPLATMRTAVVGSFDFLHFIKEISFVHLFPFLDMSDKL